MSAFRLQQVLACTYLRQDPDTVLVGEIRDLETAEVAVQAALTGHLVLSTLHTNDTVATITRLVNMGCEPFLVTASVNTIVAQRLLRTLCTQCKVPLRGSRASTLHLRH
jgi:type IV pilus assembly protein PilB